ncbi:MAG: DNA-binding protein [Candidatus Omnitrophota bacterium]
MLKSSSIFVATMIFLLMFSSIASAQSLKITDLISQASLYEGESVSMEGEVIGHVMKRGNYAWFNINDGANSLGIWANLEIANQIQYLGKHSVVGDRVKIDGVFNSHCAMHGGDTDIHAENLVIIARGNIRKLAYDPRKHNILLFLIGLMACLYIIKILKRRR